MYANNLAKQNPNINKLYAYHMHRT